MGVPPLENGILKFTDLTLGPYRNKRKGSEKNRGAARKFKQRKSGTSQQAEIGKLTGDLRLEFPMLGHQHLLLRLDPLYLGVTLIELLDLLGSLSGPLLLHAGQPRFGGLGAGHC
jgi:hypothetical protein